MNVTETGPSVKTAKPVNLFRASSPMSKNRRALPLTKLDPACTKLPSLKRCSCLCLER